MQPEVVTLEYFLYSWPMWNAANTFFRKGQRFLNALQEYRPDLANALTGSTIDPFHVDKNLPAAIQYIIEHWKPKVFYVPVVIVEENHKDAIGLCMVKPLCEYDAQTGGLLVHMGDMIPAPEEE